MKGYTVSIVGDYDIFSSDSNESRMEKLEAMAPPYTVEIFFDTDTQTWSAFTTEEPIGYPGYS